MRPGLKAAFIFLAAAASLAAQEGKLRVVERTDWSDWIDGVYAGRSWRESRATLMPAGVGGSWKGEWFLLEDMTRAPGSEAKALDESGPLALDIGPFGAVADDGVSPIPSLRGLLDIGRAVDRSYVIAATPGRAGSLPPADSTFVAPGLRTVRLRGGWHRLAFLAEYRVGGTQSYANRTTVAVKARFATRLQAPDGDLVAASGTHEIDIRIDSETGMPILVRDLFDDSYTFSDGHKERMAGSNLVFWTGGDSVGSEELLASVDKALGSSTTAVRPSPAGPAATDTETAAPGTAVPSTAVPSSSTAPALLSAGPGQVKGGGELPAAPTPRLASGGELTAGGIEVGQGEAGLVLRIEDIHFVADSAELLPTEAGRLDLVAKALLSAPADRNFLVEGHAAATGRPEGELALSAERAKAVVDALVARGIPAARFVWRGLGSSKPLASNDTEEGRARNRRVEITILD